MKKIEVIGIFCVGMIIWTVTVQAKKIGFVSWPSFGIFLLAVPSSLAVYCALITFGQILSNRPRKLSPTILAARNHGNKRFVAGGRPR